MKLLKLRLENLASLSGVTEIDFTRPDFADSGIFLITGPTGSGKSTLLDAICLALYHRTPRQDRVTKSSNEVITRGAGHCLAEVEFAVAGKGYRASFSQRRARDRAEGALQNPQVELASLDGTVISSLVSDKLRDIEQITGLDFERFTRSILLAQGAFATFLNAKPGEMAALLEELTGTEIYARLSEAAFLQARDSAAALKGVNDRLSGVQFLDPGARAALEQNLADLARQVDDSEKQRTARQAEAHAWSVLETLTTELDALNADWSAMDASLPAHEQDRLRLAAAQRALPVQAARTKVQTAQQQLQRNQHSMEQVAEQKQSGQAALDQQQIQDARLAQGLAAANAEAERRQTLVTEQILPLDQTLLDLHQRLGELSTEHAQAVVKQQEKTGESQALTQQIDSLNAELLAATDAMRALEVPEHWLAQWPRIETLDSQCEQLATDLAALDRQIADHQTGQSALQAELQGRAQTAQAARAALAASENELKEAREAQDSWLAGRSLDGLEDARQQAHARTVQLQELSRRQSEFQGLSAQLAEAQAACQAAAAHCEASAAAKAQLETVVEQTKTRLADKQLLRDQQQLILKLDHLRHQLVAGEACPLCGGLEHPYAEDLPELAPEAAEQAVQATMAELDRQQAALQQAHGRRAAAAAQVASCEQTLQRARQAREQAAQPWQDQCQRAGLALTIEDTVALAEALQRATHEHSRAEADIRQLRDSEKALQVLLDRLQGCRTADQAAQSSLQQTQRKVGELTAVLTQTQQQQEREHQRERAALGQLVDLLGLATLTRDADPTQRRSVLADLRQRTARHRALGSRKQRIETEHAESGQKLALCQSELRHAIEVCEQVAQKQQQLTQQRSVASIARSKLLPLDTDAGAWLKAAREAAQHAQKERDQSQQALHSLSSGQTALIAEQNLLAQQKQDLSRQVAVATRDFEQTRVQAGFASDAEFAAACLPEDARQGLQGVVDAYAQQRQSLNVRREQKQREHAAAQARVPENTTRDSTRDALAAASTVHTDAVSMQATLIEKRKADDHARNQNAALLQERSRLESAHQQFERLSDLIGSANGDKFRRFAQGLTLDNLLVLANQRLADLHGRYLLRRQQNQELALEVLDGWQGDAPRDTSTLSGGESFLVSLALALGLSDLVSERPIDSLFLDEGFGTLDADTLEIALNALDQLHARGKMIGVISHVEALKERIQVQIKLCPAAGAGLSRVALPWQGASTVHSR